MTKSPMATLNWIAKINPHEAALAKIRKSVNRILEKLAKN
jgi:hypothetical protein